MRCGCGSRRSSRLQAPKPKGGRPRVSDRAALHRDPVRAQDRYCLGVLACRDGLWERDGTCWRRLRDWYKAGVWRRLHQVLLEELAQADRIDWDRAALDSAAVPAPGSPVSQIS